MKKCKNKYPKNTKRYVRTKMCIKKMHIKYQILIRSLVLIREIVVHLYCC